MDYLKVMENISGKMEVLIKEILNKDNVQVMECGKQVLIGSKDIKVTTVQTKRWDMGFTHGITAGLIEEISITTLEMALVNFLTVKID